MTQSKFDISPLHSGSTCFKTFPCLYIFCLFSVFKSEMAGFLQLRLLVRAVETITKDSNIGWSRLSDCEKSAVVPKAICTVLILTNFVIASKYYVETKIDVGFRIICLCQSASHPFEKRKNLVAVLQN